MNFTVSVLHVLHFLQENNGSTLKCTFKFVEGNLEITGKLPKLEIGEMKFKKAFSRAYQVSAAVLL